ncbi:MAG: alpha-L-rhamnosidase [Dysgonamonadaceae bacterium]|jgi:hypothetical protein|nr:alpha-L-rhamnosidase [Dysgonamonadaceae bacterium]
MKMMLPKKRALLCPAFCFAIALSVYAQKELRISNLSVNLLGNTERIFLNGYPSITPLNKAINRKEQFQFTEISTRKPFFGWVVESDKNDIRQKSYRIIVSSSEDSLSQKGKGDMWDSGIVENSQSTNVFYDGASLSPGKLYFWRVSVWDNEGNESPPSAIGTFKTSEKLNEYATDKHPMQKQDERAVKIENIAPNHYFLDFARDAFGRLRANLFSENGTDTLTLHLGEAVKNGRINPSPGGTIRYSTYRFVAQKGWNTYIVDIRPDQRNTNPPAVLMPDYIGEVTPFRYCEIENYKHKLSEGDIVRETVFYPFNETDSYFHSSDSVLNQVWELCKYSIKATSFAGLYVDGDRERIPYEADALINQLSHYCTAREYNIARASYEHLITHPTWPTEWILQTPIMAWFDYLYTGDSSSFSHHYADLKAKTLLALADENGFISTRTRKVTPEILRSIHFNGTIRDIVDWPQTGGFGAKGESDGYVFTDINTVVNAYHYRALSILQAFAEHLNKTDDAELFETQARKLKESFNKLLFDKKRGVYVDGIGTDHASLHANMFALAFGLVPEKDVASVLRFIESRKMACSVYGAQFLMDALYDYGNENYGLQLLASTEERSWYNMVRQGSTISMEAWDNKFKPNQDWNHAWGAVPANTIARKLMGIEPYSPGFEKISIKPQPGSLKYAEIKHPTIRGDVFVKFENKAGLRFQLEIQIPANTTAIVRLPFYGKGQSVEMNGKTVPYKREGKYATIEHVGAGKWIFTVKK